MGGWVRCLDYRPTHIENPDPKAGAPDYLQGLARPVPVLGLCLLAIGLPAIQEYIQSRNADYTTAPARRLRSGRPAPQAKTRWVPYRSDRCTGVFADAGLYIKK